MFKIIFSVWSTAIYVDFETVIALNAQQVISENICKLDKENSYCNPFLVLEDM